MKWTLISFLCIVAIGNAAGQKQELVNEIKGYIPIDIASDEINESFTPPPDSFLLKSAKSAKCNIVVNYVNFPEEAKKAFEYAVSIYEQNISSTVPIVISATWESLDGNILAKGGSSSFHKDFNSAIVPNVYYPVALVEKLSGKAWNDEKDADIVCSFDSKRPWYFGSDGNTPRTKYDFVTVVLHEITHGLGISGFLNVEDGLGKINTPGNNPSIYDYFIFNLQNQRISDNSYFPSPSSQLLQQLTSNNLNFTCVDDCNFTKAEIYAPSKWNSGVSIYHLKNTSTCSNSKRELMSSSIKKGEAIHTPGENIFHIFSEIGWNAIPFALKEIKDYGKAVANLPVQTKFIGSLQVDCSKVQVIFSTDRFLTKDSVTLTYNSAEKIFEGSIPLNFYLGKVQYYFDAVTSDNKILTYPSKATKKVLKFKIGPDYYSPILHHNPTKIISNINPEIRFSATASDNTGISSVIVEYKINNVAQKSIQLNCQTNDVYCGKLNLPAHLTSSDKLEYRIVAVDESERNNKKFMPMKGFYKVNIFEPKAPASGFYTDFNSVSNNIISTDFEVTTPAGFSDGNLHTNHPYQQSNITNERYNLIAQLNTPIILKENGIMKFDEVVLVEPGNVGANFTDKDFCDFVIIEGSKDNGKTWQPFVDGYDSRVNEEWESKFSSTLKSSTSSATGHKNMFWENSINLTDNKYFAAGDTVIFRFRLASDKSVTGWGWAIDNLNIQMLNTSCDKIADVNDVKIYPNPFTNSLFIDCSKLSNSSKVEIMITDLVGKTVYRETKYDSLFNPKLQINLPDIKPGIYIASITDADLNTITQKIIKN